MPTKLMVVFGTRPDTIKLAPVIQEAQQLAEEIQLCLVATAQHREQLDDVLQLFGIEPHHDLQLMTAEQPLAQLTARIIEEMEQVLSQEHPDLVMVQGDTTTTLSAALAAYYAQIPVAHVEAGLRTHHSYAPFPEELNRRLTSAIANFHFAPTKTAQENLVAEGIDPQRIYLTGNTVIDALLWVVEKLKTAPSPLPELEPTLRKFERVLLITGHRRESFGVPIRTLCGALRSLAEKNPSVAFVYPVHLNPNVQRPVTEILRGLPNFFLLPPLNYVQFVWLMNRAYLIITDSGGIQEEAPALGKPVLVTRQHTERPEALAAGTARLVGTDGEKLSRAVQTLLDDAAAYEQMAQVANPFGDGKAADRILKIIRGVPYEAFLPPQP